ncbi:MAG: DMT family protein [Rhodobacteraceae bacterium]|nr:DMT family protein [Paracoccaceae bacterium]
MPLPVPVITIGLLLASNVFMTFAWYGHLRFKDASLVSVIVISWGIALFEYMLMVPANRIGHGHCSAAELKTIQEVITLSVFAVFSVVYLKEPLTWNYLAGFTCIGLGAFFIFHKWA